MSNIGRCPKCGKVIAYRFPIHDCKPTPNFKAAKKEAENLRMADASKPKNARRKKHAQH